MKLIRPVMLVAVCAVLSVADIACALDASSAEGDQAVAPEPVQGEAPLNPDFINYTRNRKVVGLSVEDGEARATGLIPSPLDRSHLTGKKIKSTQLPVSASAPTYDLRTPQQVTPVRNQKDCGVCWAFASIGSLESNLRRIDPLTQSDFSENNMKNLLSSSDPSGYDRDYCDGGNSDMATAYLARWNGPVNETDDPYTTKSGVSPAALVTKKHIQEVLILPDRSGPLDNDTIKQAVVQYGGVYTSYYVTDDTPYWNSTTNSYYYDGSAVSNHAVVIVGWDDNYSRTNFAISPAGNGAFIVRNSWGGNWGQGGYFYVSYHDSKFGKDNAAFVNAESPANYSRVYQYDPLGMTSRSGFGTTTAWFANVFTAAATERLAAVSFYTTDLNCSYEIRAYTGVSDIPTSGTSAMPVVNGSLPLPGYHTITLPTPTTLTAGQKFSVVVKVTTSGDTYPIPVEKYYSGYSSKVTAAAGQSYISSSGTSWTDATSGSSNRSVCLKAFTIAAGDVTPPTVTAFAIPATSTSLTVPVSAFTATDGVGVTGYLISESATAPAASAAGWSGSAPSSFTFSAAGTRTAHAWARDAAGNVSSSRSAPVVITLDSIAPVVGLFTIPATSGSLTVPVTSLTATDNVAVTGYLLTESSATPSASAAGWSATPPVSFTCSSVDANMLYAWAKDAAGNVSAARSAPLSISMPVTAGDLNGSGTIDIADALQALRFAVGAGTPTAAQMSRGDVSPLSSEGKPLGGNGIDISDALMILRRSVGLIMW